MWTFWQKKSKEDNWLPVVTITLFFLLFFWTVDTNQRLTFLGTNIQNQWHTVELSYLELWAVLPQYSLSQEDKDYLEQKSTKELILSTAAECKKLTLQQQQLSCYQGVVDKLHTLPSYENVVQKELTLLQENISRYQLQVQDYNILVGTFPYSVVAGLQRHAKR